MIEIHRKLPLKARFSEITSICRRVFATSSGHVAADAKIPATNPAEKFATRIVAALASSSTRPRILFLICKGASNQYMHEETPQTKKYKSEHMHFLTRCEEILLAQGLTSKLQSMEHPEKVVLQGQSTRICTYVLLKKLQSQ